MKKAIQKNGNRKACLKRYSQHLKELLSRLDYDAIDELVNCFLRARDRDLTIFFVGNGGSAATASHFAQDLGEIGRKSGTKAFRTLCLSDSAPFITAVGNDYGYDKIFANQLSNLFKKNDVLVAISASGNSPNVLEAVRLAKKLKGTVVGLVGFDGGKLAGMCDHLIRIGTQKGEYGPVEDMHLVLNHMVTSCLMMRKGHEFAYDGISEKKNE